MPPSASEIVARIFPHQPDLRLALLHIEQAYRSGKAMSKRTFSQQWIIDCRNKFWPAELPVEIASGGPPVLSAIAELIEQNEQLAVRVSALEAKNRNET